MKTVVTLFKPVPKARYGQQSSCTIKEAKTGEKASGFALSIPALKRRGLTRSPVKRQETRHKRLSVQALDRADGAGRNRLAGTGPYLASPHQFQQFLVAVHHLIDHLPLADGLEVFASAVDFCLFQFAQL